MAPATPSTATCAGPSPEAASILLIGDSLTQTGFEGWVGQLAHRYQRRADVLNRGSSGYTTDFYLRYSLPYLPPSSTNVKLIIICFGANDAALKEEDPHHHVPLDRFTSNLQQLVEHVQTTYTNSSPTILLLTPPALNHEQRLAYQIQRFGAERATGRLERTNSNTLRYAQAVQRVGNTTHSNAVVIVVDLFTLFTPHTQDYLSDGLHFSPAGHTAVYNAIVAALEQQAPDLHVTPCPVTESYNNSSSTCPALPTWGPYHDKIEANDQQE